MAFCIRCGATLQADDRFCSACGRAAQDIRPVAPTTKPPHLFRKHPVLSIIGVVLLIAVPWILSLQDHSKQQQQTVQNSRPELSTKEIGDILFESYVPSFNMLDTGIDLSAGRWRSWSEAASRCSSGNCYYLSYQFNIVDAQGVSHDVDCEWDVDATQHTAAPRNPQARYYWTHK